MKKIIETTDEAGLESLLGEQVALWCECYIYAGTLVGVNESCVLLDDAKVVYETGPLMEAGWKDAQSLPSPWYVQVGKIESFGAMT